MREAAHYIDHRDMTTVRWSVGRAMVHQWWNCGGNSMLADSSAVAGVRRSRAQTLTESVSKCFHANVSYTTRDNLCVGGPIDRIDPMDAMHI